MDSVTVRKFVNP